MGRSRWHCQHKTRPQPAGTGAPSMSPAMRQPTTDGVKGSRGLSVPTLNDGESGGATGANASLAWNMLHLPTGGLTLAAQVEMPPLPSSEEGPIADVFEGHAGKRRCDLGPDTGSEDGPSAVSSSVSLVGRVFSCACSVMSYAHQGFAAAVSEATRPPWVKYRFSAASQLLGTIFSRSRNANRLANMPSCTS
mmetsp:Transcript_76448/g.151258  ORF Transcript_76448/g.151258 Transcript_76448/m.151258 type:complete len:192 (-) Transcript_76448:930-1505(-)